MASPRVPAPPYLYISKRRTSSSVTTTTTTTIDASTIMSRDYRSETTPLAPPHHSRTSSSSSSESSSYSYTAQGAMAMGAKSQPAASPRNVYTHCGRHTDQYLFGGRGFGDMWRAITKKE